jgi:hypothetical protein
VNIAIDWDNTFTRDPIGWQDFITHFVDRLGHSVWIVTSRSERTPIDRYVSGIEGVIYCDFAAKKDITDQRGIDIHVWIDDDPIWITQSAESYPLLFENSDDI